MSKFNKGTIQVWFPTIVGTIIVLLIGGGILAWQYFGYQEKKQPEIVKPPETTIDEQKLAEKVVKEYENALKTRRRDNVLPYTTGKLKEEIQEWLPVFGMSNPHPGGCEILSSKKLNDTEFEVIARHIEEYNGQGITSYTENTYTVNKIGDKFLISSIEYGKPVEIASLVKEFFQCSTMAECRCKWNPNVIKTYCPDNYQKISGAYYDGKNCVSVTWCTVPFSSIEACKNFCTRKEQ